MPVMKSVPTLLLFFVLSCSLMAQEGFRTVDSISYRLFADGQWEELAKFGKEAIDSGFDYYYLDLRTGIAFYRLKKYNKARKYFLRAVQKNSLDPGLNEYLFWSNFLLKRDIEATKWYQKLPDSIQQSIDFNPQKIWDAVYAEGGMRIPDKSFASTPAIYANMLVANRFNRPAVLTQSLTYQQQTLDWGRYSQKQYYIRPDWAFNRIWSTGIAFHGAAYRANIDYRTMEEYTRTFRETTPFGPREIDTIYRSDYKIIGAHKQSDYLFQVHVTATGKALQVTPYYSFWISDQQPSYREEFHSEVQIVEKHGQNIVTDYTTTWDSSAAYADTTLYQNTIGLKAYYYENPNYVIGGDFKMIRSEDKNYWYFSPYLKLILNKNISLSGYYFKKGSYRITLPVETQMINTRDAMERWSFTATYSIRPFTFYWTYQNDQNTDQRSGTKYAVNSFYLGINYKF